MTEDKNAKPNAFEALAITCIVVFEGPKRILCLHSWYPEEVQVDL